MHFFSLAAAALLALSLPASAAPAPVSSISRRAKVLLPADDPFYAPPAGFENEAPGTILRSRAVKATPFSLLSLPVHVWQLLYRTTAVNGSAIATVTTVFQPYNAFKDRFVSYSTAYDSANTHCNPSYAYLLGSIVADNVPTILENLLIQGYLAQGYTVSSADYEGPDAAFSVGRLEGMLVLDSLRAVSNFGKTLGFNTTSPDIVGVGYSGGAIATGWAASLQRSYAPTLPVKAWVHGGTPVNMSSILLHVANTSNSGYLPASLAGLTKPSAYGTQLVPVLDDILTAKGKDAIQYASQNCETSDIAKFPFTSLLSYELQDLGPGLLEEPTMKKVMQENLMGLTRDLTPMAPVSIGHARQDEIIPYAPAAALVDRYCARGVDVTFTTYNLGGHLSSGLSGFPETYQYVNDAFAGKLAKGCIRKTELKTILNPVGLVAELEPVMAKLGDVLHGLLKGS